LSTVNKIHNLVKKSYTVYKFLYTLLYFYISLKQVFLLNKYRSQLLIALEKDLDIEDSQKKILIDFISKTHYFDFHFDLTFPYDFVKGYNPFNVVVYYDKTVNMSYVLHYDKKLYFPKNYGKCLIQNIYNQLLIEQDSDSPHKYLNDDFYIENGDILVDAGACEGFFALENIDKCEKAYLIEPDEHWREPLAKTFEPYNNKVCFIPKFVSDINNNDSITLDNLFVDTINKNVFVKADIEGFELNLLKGSQNLFKKNNMKLVLCTYHNQFDSKDLDKYLKNLGFKTHFTKGYMLPLNEEFFNKIEYPYFRKGIIRARNYSK